MDIREFAERLEQVETGADSSSLMEALRNLRGSELPQLREKMAGIWYIWPWLSRDAVEDTIGGLIGDELPQPIR